MENDGEKSDSSQFSQGSLVLNQQWIIHMQSYFFLRSFSGIVGIYAGCQFCVLYSDLSQVLILLIKKLVRLPCVYLIYVMTENIIYANNSEVQKLSLFF